MDYGEQYEFFQPFLQPGEPVLWCGAPGPGKLSNTGTIPLLFGLVWLVFSLFWEATVVMSGQIVMMLFGLPFVIIGVLMVFGEPLRRAKLKGKVYYVVTDRRLLIRQGQELKIFTPEMLPPMQIRMNANGTGTIYFERMATYRSANSYSCVCALCNLSDVAQAQSALTTMLGSKSA